MCIRYCDKPIENKVKVNSPVSQQFKEEDVFFIKTCVSCDNSAFKKFDVLYRPIQHFQLGKRSFSLLSAEGKHVSQSRQKPHIQSFDSHSFFLARNFAFQNEQ